MRRLWAWVQRTPLSIQLVTAASALIALAVGGAGIWTTFSPGDGVMCGPSRVAAVVSVDRARYTSGAMLHLTSTVRNTSSEPCAYASSVFEYDIASASGPSLGGGAFHADRWSTESLTLAPGGSLTQAGEWDLRDCLLGPDRCEPAAPGNYVVDVAWTLDGKRITTETSFQVA